MAHFQVLVIGGGSAGLAVAAGLRNQVNPPSIGIVEPSEKHYYQPIWTLVGGGVFDREVSERNEADYIPEGCEWLKDYAQSFDPDNNSVTLRSGEQVTYDFMVVAAGIQINWDAIPGLKESVGKPGTGVVSNYSFSTVESTWKAIQDLKAGDTALFTQPNTPIKCGGAPIKICFLANDHLRKQGLLGKVDVKFCSAGGGIFAVEKYANSLRKVAGRYGFEQKYNTNLVELNPDKKEATFENLQTGEKETIAYNMIHVTPPQGPPDFIKNSPLAAESGWVEVDKHTTRHVRFDNVFALGDCSNLPTSKTGAAIRKQAPVTVQNVMAAINSRELAGHYDGYTSCPLVTGYGKLILAEFDYDKQPKESFPFDQGQERYSMYALKAHALPKLYWHGMLRGREF